MQTAQLPTAPIRYGCVQRLGFSPEHTQILEGLRIRHKHASIEDVLREALYDLADAKGIIAPRILVTDEDRAKLAARGLASHENVVSARFARSAVKKPGRVYIDLVVFYDGDDNWPNQLREQLGCEWFEVLGPALDLYMAKPPPP